MNLRPPGYEPGELPDCSTPRRTQKSSTAPHRPPAPPATQLHTLRPVLVYLWAALGLSVVLVIASAGFAVDLTES